MSDEPKAVSCPVCENLCSTQAAACPKCGHPINQSTPVVRIEDKEATEEQTDAGSILRGILWVLFAVSLFYALGAISIATDMPYPVTGRYGNEAEITANKIAIAYRVAPLILLIVVLAIAYSARGKR